VKPQSAAFLEKSRQFLAKAQELLDAHLWPDEAGRAAYLAGFHAARSRLYELLTQRRIRSICVKSHKA